MRLTDILSSLAAVGLAAALLALGTACTAPTGDADAGGSPPAPASSADDDALVEAHLALMRAFEKGDADAVTALLDDTDALLVFHAMNADRFDGIEQIRVGLEEMFGREGNRKWREYHPLIHVDGDFGWITSHSVLEAPSERDSVAMRGTEIWRRRGSGWRMVHAHWSVQP